MLFKILHVEELHNQAQHSNLNRVSELWLILEQIQLLLICTMHCVNISWFMYMVGFTAAAVATSYMRSCPLAASNCSSSSFWPVTLKLLTSTAGSSSIWSCKPHLMELQRMRQHPKIRQPEAITTGWALPVTPCCQEPVTCST